MTGKGQSALTVDKKGTYFLQLILLWLIFAINGPINNREKMRETWKKILPWLKNKYILTLIIFFVWMLFLDTHNMIDRFISMRQLSRMKHDREYYLDRIEKDSARMNELRTNRENLEKFAREQYLMKKEDEDIFIIIFED